MMNVKSAPPNIFEVDDNKLIEKFVQGSDRLLATTNLRLEVNGGVSQLLARSGDPIAIMYLQHKPRTVIVKHSTQFSELIDRLLVDRDFVMFGDASRSGFIEYKHYVTPAGYKILYTEPAILWKKWWPTEKFQDKQRFNMDILVSVKHNWYPVQNINVNAGIFTIKTIAGQLVLKRDGKVLWLAQSTQAQALSAEQLPIGLDASPTTVAQLPNQTAATTPIYAPSSSDLAEKIQRKQSAIDPDRAWLMIKQLEEKLQSQIKLNTEIETKLNRAESRTVVAEQRLQVIYKYLKGMGIDPQDIYSGKKNTDN